MNNKNDKDLDLGDSQEISQEYTIQKKQTFLTLISWVLFITVVVATLVAGLMPRGSFSDNWVDWDSSTRSTNFGAYGIAHGEFPDIPTVVAGEHGLSIRMLLIPVVQENSGFNILAQIGLDVDKKPLIFGQWQTRFIVLQGRDFANREKLPRLGVDIAEHMGHETEIVVRLHRDKNELYINNVLTRHHAPSSYTLDKTGALINIGNSPDGKHGWQGKIREFDISLSDAMGNVEEILRSYNFKKKSTEFIIAETTSDSVLKIPKPGNFPDERILQKVSIRDLYAYSSVDLVLNLIGFAPLGFALAWAVKRVISPNNSLLAIKIAFVLSSLVSLVIESVQPYIPGRNSHLHDLILNVAGGLVGALLFACFCWLVFSREKIKQSGT